MRTLFPRSWILLSNVEAKINARLNIPEQYRGNPEFVRSFMDIIHQSERTTIFPASAYFATLYHILHRN